MATVEISTTLDGGATLGAGATATYAADSTQAGSSSQSAAAGLALPGTSSLAGSSSVSAETVYALEADFSSSSTMSATASVAYKGSVDFAAGSNMAIAFGLPVNANLSAGAALSAAATVSNGIFVAASGGSSMGANATVKSAASVAMAGGSALSGVTSYAQILITSHIVGSSDMLGDAIFLGEFGEDSYGGSPYGGKFPAFGLESALALSPIQVRIRYTAMFDAGFPLLLAISNYSISPPAVINSIILESAQSVLLNLDPLTAPVYTVTISDARGYFGQPLDLTLNSAEFLGVAAGPTFYAVATSKRRVRAVFSEPMLSNASLTNPAQYDLTTLSGDPVLISSVTTEQLSDVRSTVLQLGEDLVDERHYRLTLLSGIISQELAPVAPDTSVFQWVENTLRAQIPVARFSGEVMEGLFGIHGGLVFFSPALETPASNSIIQVEQVDVCTRAYDEYHFPPQLIDPSPLMTHGSSIAPTAIVSTLNSADWVLWATFPRLVEAKFELGLGSSTAPLEDSVPTVMDAVVEISLTESWPPDRVAILNNTDWKLFDNLGNPPAYFITADNLTPFPHATTFSSFTMFGGSAQVAESDLL